MWRAFLLCVGMGLASLVLAALIFTGRLGPDSRWYRRHRDKTVERYFRNGLFAALPYGVSWLIFAVALLLEPGSTLRNVVIGVGMAGLMFAVSVPFFPPPWLKPRWVRDLDQS